MTTQAYAEMLDECTLGPVIDRYTGNTAIRLATAADLLPRPLVEDEDDQASREDANLEDRFER